MKGWIAMGKFDEQITRLTQWVEEMSENVLDLTSGLRRVFMNSAEITEELISNGINKIDLYKRLIDAYTSKNE
jgi:hypothetical protein